MVVLTNLPPPSEGIRFQQPQTVALLNGENLGNGSLYVTESCVSWVAEGGNGFSLQYPAISVHAVSRDLSSYPHECIYLMVNAKASDLNMQPNAQEAGSSENGIANEEEEEEEEEPNFVEIRFIPVDKSVLDGVFQALSDCQELHPDEDDDFSDDDGTFGEMGEGEFMTSSDGVGFLGPDGQANLERIMQNQQDTGDDDDQMEEDSMDAESNQNE